MTEIAPAGSRSQSEDARAALLRIGERILEVEGVLAEVRQFATTLEHEMIDLGSDMGRLNTVAAQGRRARVGA
jgi:hypothetical protein